MIVVVLDTGVNYDHEDLAQQDLAEPRRAAGHRTAQPARRRCGDPYDCNANGAFNVLDYTGDSRITDTSRDRSRAATCASSRTAIDDDGNGFIDDISGWDARDGDGDEFRTNGDGHGTGRNGFIAAETNNGKGIAGICPSARSPTCASTARS